MSEEKFEVFESSMNFDFSLEEVQTLENIDPYSGLTLEINAIVDKLREIEFNVNYKNRQLVERLLRILDITTVEEKLPRHFRKRRSYYSAERRVGNKKVYIPGSKNLAEAIEKYHIFCKENNLKP